MDFQFTSPKWVGSTGPRRGHEVGPPFSSFVLVLASDFVAKGPVRGNSVHQNDRQGELGSEIDASWPLNG